MKYTQIQVQDIVTRRPVNGSVIRDVTCSVSLVDFLKLASKISLEKNPRRPRYSKVVHEMVSSLNAHPANFQREHPGICIAVDGFKTAESGRAISLPDTLYVFNGGHSTLALLWFAISQMNVFCKAKDFDSARDAVVKSCVTDLDNAPKAIQEVRVPLHIYYPIDSAAATMTQFASELCVIAKNANTSAALSTHGMAEASGVFEPLKRVIHTPIPIRWKDRETTDSRGALIVCCSLLGILIHELQTKFPEYRRRVTGTTDNKNVLSLKQACESSGFCVEHYRYIMNLPGVMDHTTMCCKDKKVASMLTLMQDMLEAYDCIGKWFTTLFNAADKNKHKFERVYRSVGGKNVTTKQCPFGFQETAEQIVARGFLMTVAAGLGKLMRYNEAADMFEWIIRPQDIFTDSSMRAELSEQLRTFMRSVRAQMLRSTSDSIAKKTLRDPNSVLMVEAAIENMLKIRKAAA